jgi:uncharacterized radical SAM protein YgiQ
MFLPIDIDECKRYYKADRFDVVFISGDPYYDHPLSGVAILSRLLDKRGYKVGIVAQPLSDADYKRCGSPRYFFCITSGLLDSMLANYTPMMRKRENIHVPERAVIAYTQKIKQLFKDKMTVIGGVEATIRRFTHFDYWDNGLRRGILNDSKADILAFGNAERSLLELLDRMKKHKESGFGKVKDMLDLKTIFGISYRIKKPEEDERILPSYEECMKDKIKFNLLTRVTNLLPDDSFVEPCGLGFVRHNEPSPPLTDEEMDMIYSMEFEREIHPRSRNYKENSDMVRGLDNSVIIGRGCWGSCNFCIIPLVQGKNIAKRSKGSILKEIETLYKKGVKKINDLTLPTVNMYGSYCSLYDKEEKLYSHVIKKEITWFRKTEYCDQNCVGCRFRVLRDDLYPLLEEVERLNTRYDAGLVIRSAIRHDIILQQKKLFRKIMEHTERLKIAPEHISDTVLKSMNKATKKHFVKFLKEFEEVNKEQGTRKNLVPYFVVGHPGSGKDEMRELKEFCEKHNIYVNLTQVFTPTPGTVSTAAYYTGIDPVTKKEVYVARTFRERKDQKNMLQGEFSDDNG